MGDFQRWQAALETWVEASTGLTALWENEPRPVGPIGPIGAPMKHQLAFMSGPHEIRSKGQDWLENVMVGSALIPTPRGPRVGVYTIKVVSRDQSPDQKAGRFLELARYALSLPAIREMFRVAGMGLAAADKIRLMDGERDGRWESVATMDLTWNLAPSDAPAGVDQGWIERVTAAAELPPGPDVPDLDIDSTP